MKKLSIIRNENVVCPFGLEIPRACSSIGTNIFKMSALPLVDEEDIDKAKRRNKIIYLTQKGEDKCPFADQILEKFGAVNCSWGDVAAAEGSGNMYLHGSPLYPSVFIGNGTSPSPREQPNYDASKSFEEPGKGIDVPFGLFSIFSSSTNTDQLIKLAETTNKTPNIREKLSFLRKEYGDILQRVYANEIITELNNTQLKEMLVVINEWTDGDKINGQ